MIYLSTLLFKYLTKNGFEVFCSQLKKPLSVIIASHFYHIYIYIYLCKLYIIQIVQEFIAQKQFVNDYRNYISKANYWRGSEKKLATSYIFNFFNT